MSRIPFLRKASSISEAASSSESRPSLRATLERSMIFLIISGAFNAGGLKIRVILFNPPMKSGMVLDIMIAQNAPPNVMIADCASRKLMIAPKSTPFLPYTIPNTIIKKHMSIPNNDAKSITIPLTLRNQFFTPKQNLCPARSYRTKP